MVTKKEKKVKKDSNDDAPKKKSALTIVDETKELALAAIKKKYGDVLKPLSESQNDIKTVSTGSLNLDLALGRGGMALGRVYEVYGPNSSGKTTLGISVVIQAQKRGMRCAYLDAEQSVDPKLFERYGVNSKELELVQVYGGEPNLDILERLIKTGVYDVIVIDSVSALIPSAEAQAEIEKDTMALQARLMSKALRKISPQAAETNTLLIFVNQIRKNLSPYAPPDTTSGGESLGFYATGRVSLKGPEARARRIIDPVSGEVVGHEAIHEIVKNKLGEPFRKATLRLMYGKGYDMYAEVLSMATSLNIIEKAGSWFKYEGENIGQGEINILKTLRTNEELFNKIVVEVRLITGLETSYVDHCNPGPIYTGEAFSGSAQ